MHKSKWNCHIAALAIFVGACGGDIADLTDPGRCGPATAAGVSGFCGGSTTPEPVAPACATRVPDVSTSGGWRGAQASETALGALRFELKARPELPNIDALIGVGSEDINEFSDTAISVRFAEDGYVDSRDGDVYASDVRFPYEPGVWYDVVVTADVAARLYDVEIGRCGESPVRLISGAAFRSDVDQLSTWAIWSSVGEGLGVSVPTWAASGSCAPSTCESLGSACGQPDDGCDTALSCGECSAGETCSSGVCVAEPSTVPPPEPPNGGFGGGPADGCALIAGGFCCDGDFSFSQCNSNARYVRPGGGGAQDGSDWANALNGLPSELERGFVYWLGAGNYGSYTFDDAASGSAGISLRKATSQSHGTDLGWSADFGAGPAVFGPLHFEGSRYTLDGGEVNGLRSVGQMGTKVTVDVDGSHIVLRHVEIDGGFEKSNGKQTAGGCNGSNINGDHVVFDRCEVHNIADDGLGVYADHITVLYSKIHDLDGCGTDDGCGPCFNGHSDGLEISGVSDLELIGNMVYDVRSTAAIFMEDFGSGGISNLVAYNNVFYTPATGITVYLKDLNGAKIHNNIIWGRTQGSRYGGLAIGKNVTNLEMSNNIILNINYSHLSSSHDPVQHDLDYNLFGMIHSGEYTANTNDSVGDPEFVGIPMSSVAAEHKASNLTLDDFVPGLEAVIDSGATPEGIPPFDIDGRDRPAGVSWDRGPFEFSP